MSQWTVRSGLDFIIRDFGLQKLNSYTKYPSILTYHSLDPRSHLLTEQLSFDQYELEEDAYIGITEKVDGTNVRIIFRGNARDYIIGSRDRLLYAYGDRVVQDSQDSVKTIQQYFVTKLDSRTDALIVIYGEVYGNKINGCKEYFEAGSTDQSFRVFDVMVAPEFVKDMDKDIATIAGDRERDTYRWVGHSSFWWPVFESVPSFEGVFAKELPATLAETYDWLQQYRKSRTSKIGGNAEGIIIRSNDRRFIRKLRFEDYEKAKRKGVF